MGLSIYTSVSRIPYTRGWGCASTGDAPVATQHLPRRQTTNSKRGSGGVGRGGGGVRSIKKAALRAALCRLKMYQDSRERRLQRRRMRPPGKMEYSSTREFSLASSGVYALYLVTNKHHVRMFRREVVRRSARIQNMRVNRIARQRREREKTHDSMVSKCSDAHIRRGAGTLEKLSFITQT